MYLESCKHVGGQVFTGVFDWAEIRADALKVIHILSLFCCFVPVFVVRVLIALDQVCH